MSAYLRQRYLRKPTPFCPGCGHGVFMNCFLRASDEVGFDFSKAAFVSGIGCGAWVPSPHFRADTLHVTHGRPIPFATGLKLVRPDLGVVVISGDGDLASIGGNHLIHAARRDIPVKVFCLNNWVYGMTGGQVAATTPKGAKTATTPQATGNPERGFDLVKLVLGAGGKYVARFPVAMPRELIAGIGRILKYPGFAFMDVLSPCPTEYGRRNIAGENIAVEMLRWQLANCIDRRAAERMPSAGKIVIGEWVEDGS